MPGMLFEPHFQSEVQHSPRSRHEGVPRMKGAGRRPDNSAPKGLISAIDGIPLDAGESDRGDFTTPGSTRAGFGRAGPGPSNTGLRKGGERNDRLQGGATAVKTS